MLIKFKDGALLKIAEANARRRASFEDLRRLAWTYDEPGKRVLDIGIHGDVYPGGHFFLFKEADYETLDIDPNSRPTHVGDIRELDFEDGTFDLILCHSVIEHVLKDREKAYSELYRVLKRGGTLLYVIPTIIDDREVEEAKFVSQTHLLECHKGMDISFKLMHDNTMQLEVRK